MGGRLHVNDGWRHLSKFFFCTLKNRLRYVASSVIAGSAVAGYDRGLEMVRGGGFEPPTWPSRVVRCFLFPARRQRGLLTDLPRRTTCKAMLRSTCTFITTSIAKSIDKTQGKPGRKNHATAATALENNELSAEP